MMRLPDFRHRAPATVGEAVRMLADDGPSAMILAGGTDLLPNMKRRQQTPATLVSLSRISALRAIEANGSLRIGAASTLASIAASRAVAERATALHQAASLVATPQIRNAATIGGNLCLDTRCHYYDQSLEWRKAIDFCMKRDGEICWVATASKRCLAISSTDTAPALIALGARVRLASTAGERELAVADLYRNDGIDYVTKRSDEIVTEIVVPALAGWRTTYWKLRRRGSFDFPVLGVAVGAKLAPSGEIEDLRVVLGAVASRPLVVEASERFIGRALDDEAIAELAEAAAAIAKPMDNADFTLHWRKRVTSEIVSCALREIRGDDVRAERRRLERSA